MKVITVRQFNSRGVAIGTTEIALSRNGEEVEMFVGKPPGTVRHYAMSLDDLVELTAGNLTPPELGKGYGL